MLLAGFEQNIHIRRDVDEESSHSIGKRAVPGVAPNSNAGTACPIDEENRCRQSKIRIGDVITFSVQHSSAVLSCLFLQASYLHNIDV